MAPAGEKRSRKRSSCLGLRECTTKPCSHQGLDHRSVRYFDGNADDIRGRPGLGEKPRRHLGEPRPCVREGALATHAPLTVDDADLVSFRSPVDTDKPFDHFHRASSRLVRTRAAAMLTKPCTGARRRELPTGHPSRPTIGARVPPRCSRRRGRTVAPDRLAHPARNGRRPDDGSGDHGTTDCALRLPLRATRSGPTGGRVPASKECRVHGRTGTGGLSHRNSRLSGGKAGRLSHFSRGSIELGSKRETMDESRRKGSRLAAFPPTLSECCYCCVLCAPNPPVSPPV